MKTIKQVALTPQQEKLWSDTRAALIWHCPAFSHIFYTLLQNTGNAKANAVFTDDESIPIAATDGNNLIFNVGPKGFFRFNLNQRVFIASHEILHCIFNHCGISFMLKMRGKVAYPDGKTLEYDAGQMNEAEDYVINAILMESKVGQFPTDENNQQLGLYDAAIATSKDNSLDTYRKIFKKPPSGKGKGGGSGGGSGKPTFDKHLDPGTSMGQDPVSANNNRNPAQWDTAVAAGIAAAKAMGKLPAELQRALTDTLAPKVDWREHIKSLFARKVGSGTFDWSRPDRRLITRDIYAPGRSGYGAGTVVVGIDTSGSVGSKELDMFMAEVSGILEDIRPKRLVMIWCDAKVHRIDECEDISDLNTIRHKGAPGGGGTSFIPVFDAINKEGLEPEALVYLTDGLGSFPNVAPSYPVIWGNIYKGSKYPWGDVVDIPKQIES
jgi:predicted metal-dependent peptidase